MSTTIPSIPKNCVSCNQEKKLFAPPKELCSPILKSMTYDRDYFLNFYNLHNVSFCKDCFEGFFGDNTTCFYLESTYGNLVKFHQRAVEESKSAQHFTDVDYFNPKDLTICGFLPHPMFVLDYFGMSVTEPISQTEANQLLTTGHVCILEYGSSYPFFIAIQMYIRHNLMYCNEPGNFSAPYCDDITGTVQAMRNKAIYFALRNTDLSQHQKRRKHRSSYRNRRPLYSTDC